MAPREPTVDYYAILEVEQTDSLEIIKNSYRRLAVVLHPDKNPSKSNATAEFQLLLEAYETLSDPSTRYRYDRLWPGIKNRRNAQREARKGQEQAAEAPPKRAAEEALHRQRQQKASQDRLQILEQSRSQRDSSIFEINREIRRLRAELKRLQDKDDEERKKQREKSSWWAYLTSPIYGKTAETDKEKLQREAERLQRLASTSIKTNELKCKEATLKALETDLKIINLRIATEKKRYEEEARAQESIRKEQLRQEQLMQERLRQEQLRKERLRQEQLRQEQLRKEKEAWTKEQEQREREREVEVAAALHKKRQEEAARATGRARAANEARDCRKAAPEARPTPFRGTCRHKAFWAKLEGSRSCSKCHGLQRHFTFQCLGCKVIACASCRQILKGETAKKKTGNASQHYGYSPGTYADDGASYGSEYD